YSGGPAVEKARSFIALLNDTIAYNDDNICLQSGIYRFASDSAKTIEESKIIIQPNPASNEISIILKGNFEGLCSVQIQNVIGETVLTDEMNCKDSIHKINLLNIPQGIYMVKVNVNNSTFVNTKFVIIK
ncbi:MAG: T9SS type A sorting domain-containing protein, partial [Bacteroidetes bacterium]|nr:T9SS type A sorting domain-containing protein [Bacteroidota bacterium]